jgi:hypothetical protein
MSRAGRHSHCTGLVEPEGCRSQSLAICALPAEEFLWGILPWNSPQSERSSFEPVAQRGRPGREKIDDTSSMNAQNPAMPMSTRVIVPSSPCEWRESAAKPVERPIAV